MAYKRAILKISGELLDSLSDIEKIDNMELAIVIGGGNIIRGVDSKDLPRVSADQIGMLATIINALFFKAKLEKCGHKVKILSALPCHFVETYSLQRAKEYLSQGFILLFAGGTGNPYFSTDSAAALRAAEIDADIILKATKVNGVFDKDPLKFKDAVQFKRISYTEYMSLKLKVVDMTAVALCMENNISMRIFDVSARGALKKALLGEDVGTLIS